MMPEHHGRFRYAARLNAFNRSAGRNRPANIADMISAAGQVSGISAADLNYPDHFSEHSPRFLKYLLNDNGMILNGLAMRYYSRPEYAGGAFTNPDRPVRRDAIDLTRRAIDTLAEMDGKLLTLWLGQDGFDYPFQASYPKLWDDTVSALVELAEHNPQIDLAIEYKPCDPRAFALLPDVASTLLVVRDCGRNNIGVTLDFAHSLMAGEMPAYSAHLISRHARLLGVHLNDGYRRRDDGLMIGTANPVPTVELFVELFRIRYQGTIYFDTFPDFTGIDPIEEARANIFQCEKLSRKAESLAGNPELATAISRQDAVRSQQLVSAVLFGV